MLAPTENSDTYILFATDDTYNNAW